MTISSPPPVPPPPGPPPGSPPPPAKKGLSPLAWVGIGCGVIAIIGAIVVGGLVTAGGWFAKKQIDRLEKNPTLVAAEWAVRANPDLEVVSSDESKGTLTIKNKKTGEEITINAEDAKEGRISFKTDKGTAVMEGSQEGGFKVTNEKGETTTFGAGGGAQKLPSWMPVYPGGTVQGTYDVNNAEGRSVAFQVTTSDAVSKVLDFYEDQLESAGLKVSKNTFSTGGQDSGGTLSAESADGKRKSGVIVSTTGSGTQAVVTVQDKK